MRTKKLYTILTFATTTAAMETEDICISSGLRARLIPLPPQISAGCGLALRIQPEDMPLLNRLCGSHSLWENTAELML